MEFSSEKMIQTSPGSKSAGDVGAQHSHCRVCAEACRRCEAACRALVAS